jgi:predicted metal-dependent phosphoesterase TrpH
MKRQKAKICLPHPYKSHDLFLIHQDEFINQFDYIEIYNSRIKKLLNDYAVMLNNKFKKIPIIGCDAHTIEDLSNCFIKYDNKMTVIDSLTMPTSPKNIRRSQMVNAKNKKQKLQYLKYSILTLLNK